jgi:endonuclease/exonuclease/phosphatase family metal-dependent hydrolase
MRFSHSLRPDDVTACVTAFEPLSEAAIAFATTGPADKARHDACLPLVPALHALECKAPDMAAPMVKERLRVLAWNAERLKYDAPSRALYGSVAPDVALLSEVDIGMARSGNRHTVRDFAEPFGAGYVYALEFAELGLGDDREMVWHKGEKNSFGYHGNAIVSRFPLHDPFAIRLDDGAHWFTGLDAADQRRIGFRNAVAARMGDEATGIWVVVAHFENRTTPEGRAEQARRLVDALNARCGDMPIIIGGDFNTATLPIDADALQAAFADPSPFEPMFAVMKDAGFDWEAANTPEPSCRTRPDGTPVGPFTRIDWFFTRGLDAVDPATLAAVDAEGNAISDHEALRVTVTMRPA